MKREDWRSAIGGADEEFHRQLLAALDGLEEKKVKNRHKYSALLIAAIVMALLAGGAYAAARLGVLDYFERFAEPIVPLEGAEELVDTGLGTVENELVKMTVEELAFDGRSAVVQLCFTPKQPEKYALGSDMMEFEPMDVYETETVEEEGGAWEWERVLRRKDGRQEVNCRANITLTDEAGHEIWIDSWIEGGLREDGSIVIQGEGTGEEALSGEVTLQVEPYSIVLEDWDEEKNERPSTRVPIDALVVPIERRDVQMEYSLIPQGKLERVEIVSAELRLTPLLGYLSVEYKYDSLPDEDMGIDFHVYDADGERVAVQGGSRSEVGDAWRLQLEIQSFDEVPDKFYLEPKVIGEDKTLGKIECDVVEADSCSVGSGKAKG